MGGVGPVFQLADEVSCFDGCHGLCPVALGAWSRDCGTQTGGVPFICH